MNLNSIKRASAIDALEQLTTINAVVSDGDWIDRFVDLLIDENDEVAGEAAFYAIQDSEVINPVSIALVTCLTDVFNRAAAATMLKLMWLDQGFGLPPPILRAVFESVTCVPHYLMESRSIEVFRNLEEEVTIHRGQLFDAGKKPDGASWTLSEEVAQWYSAPAPGSSERGWVITATVPKSAILAVFFERDEQEAVLDLNQLNKKRISVKRGTCDVFPAHLTKSILSIY